MKDFCYKFLKRYYKRGLMAVEYMNEVNAILPADANIGQIMSVVYPVMKKAARKSLCW